jgi:hypothetical protein
VTWQTIPRRTDQPRFWDDTRVWNDADVWGDYGSYEYLGLSENEWAALMKDVREWVNG